MIRVLAFTCSRHRPLMLHHAILQMQHQTYPVDHAIYINSNENGAPHYKTDYTSLINDLKPANNNQIFVKFGKSFHQHINHFEAINLVNIEQYDLFLKIDDDDIYRSYYVEEVVEDFTLNRWDLSGSHCLGAINGHRWENQALLKYLGLEEGKKDIGMSPTWAFSRDAIKAIRTIGNNLFDNHDNLWKKHIEDETQLTLHCRTNHHRNFHYHIHGKNKSTAGWLKKNRAINNKLPPSWIQNMTGIQTVRLSASLLKQAIPCLSKDLLKKATAPFLRIWNGSIRRRLELFHTPDLPYDQTEIIKLLCLCARPTGHRAMYERLTQKATAINSWESLPYMAEQHGLAPLVYYHLREAKIEIPAEVNRTLKGAYLTHRHANRERMVALKEIAAAYRDTGIEMLALKGAALANTIYPDIALRCMCDLDLLVADDTADTARNALEDLGFNIHETASIQPRAFSHHFPPATRDRNGVGVMVELHHHLYAISKLVPSVTLDKLLPDAISFDFDQTIVDTLGPEQMLWHSYIHAVGKLQLVEQFRLIHVADLIGLVETYADHIDWQRLEKLSPQTYHAIMMLHLFTPWSDAIIESLPFDSETPFNFKDFPHLPSAMEVSSRDRDSWIPRFFKDIFTSPDWWVCFFQGNHPVNFNVISYRVVYPIHRLSAFFSNLTGFYVRKWYRKWHQKRQNRE